VWFSKKAYQKATYFVLGIILLGYSVKTIARNTVWKDNFTLFTTDAKVSLNSARCNMAAGAQTLILAENEHDKIKKKKLIENAIVYLKKGIAIYPKYQTCILMLGRAMFDYEDYKKSREYFETALQIWPGLNDALDNWQKCANMSMKNKDYNEALISYSKLISYQPENKDLYVLLAEVYENINQIDSALNIMNRILVKDPKYAPALNMMGEIYGKHFNNIDKSIEYLLRAYTISPNDASLLQNIGVAYGIKKDYKKSIEFLNKVMAIKPDDPQTYLNLADSYQNINNKKKADEYRDKAAKLQKVIK